MSIERWQRNWQRNLTPYQRIVRAAQNGKGCRLSAEDCEDLTMDTAIVDRAWLDDNNLNELDSEQAAPSAADPQ